MSFITEPDLGMENLIRLSRFRQLVIHLIRLLCRKHVCFKEVIGDRIASICSSHNVTVDYAFQDINDIPGELPKGRTKPWGTGQAVLAAKKAIKTPFIVINADDYYGKLGFSVIRENYRPERKDWKLDLRVNEHTELEIFAEENPPKRVNRPEACGLRHLAFCVDSVEQTVKELAEVGIECEPIRVDDYTGKKMTFFHDPDGLPLELHE